MYVQKVFIAIRCRANIVAICQYIYMHISLQKYKFHILFMRTHYSIDTYYYIKQYLYHIYI